MDTLDCIYEWSLSDQQVNRRLQEKRNTNKFEMTKNVNESGENLMGVQDASNANSESDAPTQPLSQATVSRRNSQLKGLERRGSDAKVLQLNVDNTWATVSPKSNTKLKSSVEKMSAVVRRGWKPEVWYKTFVGIFFVVIALLIGTTTFLYNRQKYLQAFRDKIYILEDKRHFFLLDSNGNELLKAMFAANIPGDIKSLHCFSVNDGGHLSQICREWQYRAHLSIDYQHKSNGISCYHVRWQSYDSLGTGLKDCFELENGFWFGMGLVRNLSWPLTNVSLKYSPFVTGNKLSENAPFGSIIKRYWLSSKGISIQVPLNIPLYVSFNASDEYGNFDNRLCLESRTNAYPYDSMSGSLPRLDYTICTGNSIIELHTEASKNWTKVLRTSAKSNAKKDRKGAKYAQSFSPSIFLKEIFWTTSTELFPNVTQIALQSYADKIMSYGFEPGIIMLDSRWESHTGDLTINRTNFQNPGALFNVLHYKGFKIMITVTPFIDISADSLVAVSSDKRVFVDRFTNSTLFTTCKESSKYLCALLDLLNSTTREWFQQKLRNTVVKELGVNGLLFKGVPVSLMPLNHYNYKPNIVNPDYYQLHYKNLAKYTTTLVGLDTAAGIHGLEGFFQISPLNSSWNSLRSIVPTVLTLGLIGYAIINTGSVGGDVFENQKEFDRELYIRWLELSAFLPIVQFAEPPGRNDLEIIRMAKKFLKVRDEHILPILQTSLEEYKQYGWPMIRPMWWLEPDDQDAYLINDQFAIGNDVIVAPILEQGVMERDIYLPSGWWKDDSTQIMRGGKWVRKYHVDLDKVPYFKRTDPNA